MILNLYSTIENKYNSNSQKIRVLSETWVNENIYCPNCGDIVSKYKNNKPVSDFYCEKCKEDFELKSKKGLLGKKIVDGAYKTMIDKLQSDSTPNFFFLSYDKSSLDIIDFIVIPKHFFIPEIIEKRKPLSANSKRAGWVGCNIVLDTIPQSGKIFYIKNRQIESKNKVLDNWHKTSFLRKTKNLDTKSWLIDIMRCIERVDKKIFSLSDIYQFENYLKKRYPNNNNIRPKIRQQLQILRDRRYLKFISRGKYSLE